MQYFTNNFSLYINKIICEIYELWFPELPVWIFTILFLFIALLKIVSILQAIRWIRKNGEAYISILHNNPPTSATDYYCAMEKANGTWFPFGVKDFRLRKFILHCHTEKSFWKKYCGLLAFLFQTTMYRFQIFAGIVGSYAIGISYLSNKSIFLSDSLIYLLYALTIIVLGTNALLSIEAVCCYAIFRNYAMSFHMFSLEKKFWGSGDRFLTELKIVGAKIIITLYCGTVAAFVAFALLDGFDGNSLPDDPIVCFSHLMNSIFQMAYFTTTTFVTVGFGDITPKNIFGQIVALLIEIQAFSIVALVLASLLSTKDTCIPEQKN